jgi:hypothetical protein
MAICVKTHTRRQLKYFCFLDLNREKNKNGDTAMDLIRDNDPLLQEVFKRHRNQQAMKHSVRDDDLADGRRISNWRCVCI